jgi:hypothetical protein
MTSAGVSIALAMQPLLPMADDDDKPTYSKSLTVNPLARILRPMFYGGNGRFVMSWTIVFIFVSSSLVISLSTSQLESFCASGSIKGVSFLISFWGICAFIVVIVLVFSNFTRILPSRDREELDHDEEDMGAGASNPLLYASDISIVDNAQVQQNNLNERGARPSVRYNGALSSYKITEPTSDHKSGRSSNAQDELVPPKGKKPRRFTASNNSGAMESPEMRRASSGPIIPMLMHQSASYESLRRTGGIMSNEGLAPSTVPFLSNHQRPSILRNGSRQPTISGGSKQSNPSSAYTLISFIDLLCI